MTSLSGSTYSLQHHPKNKARSVSLAPPPHRSFCRINANSHVLMLAVETSRRKLLRKAIGQRRSETLHDARVKRLLDGTTRLLHLDFLFLNGRRGNAILEDAVVPEMETVRAGSERIQTSGGYVHHIRLVLRHPCNEKEGCEFGEEVGQNRGRCPCVLTVWMSWQRCESFGVGLRRVRL